MYRKAAVLSDIHSNYEALAAVLADIYKQGIDYIYCLGDVIGYGPDPIPCLEAALQFTLTIKGNHEEAVLKNAEGFSPPAAQAINWTRKVLQNKAHSHYWYFLATLPENFQAGGFRLVHGSPLNPLSEYMLLSEVYNKERQVQFRNNFKEVSSLCFCGHTHHPGMIVQENITEDIYAVEPEYKQPLYLDLSSKYILNPGSVGQPRDYDPRASYLILEKGHVLWRRVPYNISKTKDKILNNPELNNRLGYRLMLGS